MTTTKTTYIQLNYQTDGSVTVTPEDQDRFVVTVQEAIAACRSNKETIEYLKQFKEFLIPKLIGWLERHSPKVRKAFLTVRDGGVLFLVVRKQAECDPGFTDELTDLDIEMATENAVNLIHLSVLALPDVSDKGIESFISPGRKTEFQSA